MTKKSVYGYVAVVIIAITAVSSFIIFKANSSSPKTFDQLKIECNQRHMNDNKHYVRDPCGDELIEQEYNSQ